MRNAGSPPQMREDAAWETLAWLLGSSYRPRSWRSRQGKARHPLGRAEGGVCGRSRWSLIAPLIIRLRCGAEAELTAPLKYRLYTLLQWSNAFNAEIILLS
jgi:hypothetical protein